MVTNEERAERYGTPIAIGMANGVDEPTITRAVMAVADAEQAELRAKVARVEALCESKEAAQRLANERYAERNIVEAKTGRVFQSVPILTCREVRAALAGDA